MKNQNYTKQQMGEPFLIIIWWSDKKICDTGEIEEVCSRQMRLSMIYKRGF